MATLEELIAAVRDDRLRQELAVEVRKLKERKRFGLVFEPHLPETVRLPNYAIRPGEVVVGRSAKDNRDLWIVRSVHGRRAKCSAVGGDGPPREFKCDELVAIRRFGDPIYPALESVDSVHRGGTKPWHTVINADNFHALQLLLYSYERQVDTIYIDPPYNTGARDWKYNNDYVDKQDSWRHSKWLSMMKRRLLLAQRLLKPSGVLVITIDDYEVHHLKMLLAHELPGLFVLGTLVIKTSPSGRPTLRGFRVNHEYALFVGLSPRTPIGTVPKSAKQIALFNEQDEHGRFAWANLRKRGGGNTRRTKRPKQFYPIYVSGNRLRIPQATYDRAIRAWTVSETPRRGEEVVLPIGDDGTERIWALGYHTIRAHLADLRVVREGQMITVQRKVRLRKGSQPSTFWDDKKYSIVEHGTGLLDHILAKDLAFPFPKSLYAVSDCLRIAGCDKKDALILDFFAGSGTTLHATALLNSEDEGRRRAILVTNNEVPEEVARELESLGYRPGDGKYEVQGIAESITWPRCKAAIQGQRDDGSPIAGKYVNGRSMKDGFQENAEYFKLTFVDPNDVSLGVAFEAILPILWMKADCVGNRAAGKKSKHWYLPKTSPFVVLLDETRFPQFRRKLHDRPDTQLVFLVTDSEDNFRMMSERLGLGYRTVQLYRSYLDNFAINTRMAPNA